MALTVPKTNYLPKQYFSLNYWNQYWFAGVDTPSGEAQFLADYIPRQKKDPRKRM